MFTKPCIIFSLSVMGMILFEFSQTATSLQCYKCVGANKEPYQDASCNKIQNCTGPQNNCQVRLYRDKINGPQSFLLGCMYDVDCKRLGLGCNKRPQNTTVCTKCCDTDLCNAPDSFKDMSTAPPTTSATHRNQVSLFTFFLFTLTVFL